MQTGKIATDYATPYSLAELDAAAELIYRYMKPTPQYCWPLLSRRLGCEVWVKHENFTCVGGFKVRGGILYAEQLRRENPRATGMVAATRGNHGQSLAYGARLFGFKIVIVVPHGNSVEKNAAMEALGAELIVHGADFQESFEYATQLAKERKLIMAPNFDLTLTKGVSTYALELFRGAPRLDTIYVSIGMGSGVCGVMAARNALGLRTTVVGVVSAGAPAYSISFRSHKLESHAVTTFIADGMACRKPDPLALEMIWAGVDHVVEVTDEEVEAAMRAYFSDIHSVAEGAGAAGLAAAMKERERLAGKRIGLVLSGGNVDREVFARVLSQGT